MTEDNAPSNLEQTIAAAFAHLTDSALVRRMERAGSNTNLDDETFELARRMREQGKTWRWSRDIFHPRIEIDPGTS